MQSMPFPSNAQDASLPSMRDVSPRPTQPWQWAAPSEDPPIMFKFEMSGGTEVSYCYSDLRETRLINPGYLQLCIYGFEKYLITIEGRKLEELASLLSKGRIKSIRELGERTFDRPESEPAIDRVSVDQLTGTG